MKVKTFKFYECANLMDERFRHIIQTTGTLTEDQMRLAIRDAIRVGVKVSRFSSSRSLKIINGIYCYQEDGICHRVRSTDILRAKQKVDKIAAEIRERKSEQELIAAERELKALMNYGHWPPR